MTLISDVKKVEDFFQILWPCHNMQKISSIQWIISTFRCRTTKLLSQKRCHIVVFCISFLWQRGTRPEKKTVFCIDWPTICCYDLVQIVNWRIRAVIWTAERPQYFWTISNKNDHCGPPWIVELMEPILTPFFWPHWGVKIVGTCCQKEIRLQPGQSIMCENK